MLRMAFFIATEQSKPDYNINSAMQNMIEARENTGFVRKG